MTNYARRQQTTVWHLFLQINLYWSTATSVYLYIAHHSLPTATEKLDGDNRRLQSLEYLLFSPFQKTLASSWTKQVRATFFLRSQGALPTGSWQWRGLCIQKSSGEWKILRWRYWWWQLMVFCSTLPSSGNIGRAAWEATWDMES